MTAFQFKPAVRERVSLLLALAGASGSGKTYSALRLARGLAPTGKIAAIDTEARRMLHYAAEFDFLHTDMAPPFRPARFIEAIRAAEEAGAEVVIIDSFSHEYDGEGGIMDWADELAASGVKSPGNWKDPKLGHKKMMNALLQCRASLIFCLRADEKIEIIREGGRTQVRPLGWMPICEKRFMYEMTASFTLTPDMPGRVRFDLPHKVQQQHRAMFPEGQVISEDAGRLLAAWARGDTASAAPPSSRAQRQDAGASPPPTKAPASAEHGEIAAAYDAALAQQLSREALEAADRRERAKLVDPPRALRIAFNAIRDAHTMRVEDEITAEDAWNRAAQAIAKLEVDHAST